jgi:hypothetical protein
MIAKSIEPVERQSPAGALPLSAICERLLSFAPDTRFGRLASVCCSRRKTTALDDEEASALAARHRKDPPSVRSPIDHADYDVEHGVFYLHVGEPQEARGRKPSKTTSSSTPPARTASSA